MNLILTDQNVISSDDLRERTMEMQIQELLSENEDLKEQLKVFKNKENLKSPEEEIIRHQMIRIHNQVVVNGGEMDVDTLKIFDTMIKSLVALRGKGLVSEDAGKKLKPKDAKALLSNLIAR